MSGWICNMCSIIPFCMNICCSVPLILNFILTEVHTIFNLIRGAIMRVLVIV
jgi:hypothetical protein